MKNSPKTDVNEQETCHPHLSQAFRLKGQFNRFKQTHYMVLGSVYFVWLHENTKVGCF